jgi:mRNA interferase RelE/StbE
LGWKVELTADARRTLLRIDPTIARRITQKLTDVFPPTVDPATVGEPLSGEWRMHRRIRVGDWRVIFRAEPARVTILVIKVGHRSRVY